PVLARIDQQAGSQQQCAGAAWCDQNALRVDAQAVTLGIEAGDRLAQLRQAAGGGVAGVPGSQGSLAGANDRFGSGEVRLADLQMDDIVTSSLQLVGTRQQGHYMKGFDGATAPAVELSHGSVFRVARRGF